MRKSLVFILLLAFVACDRDEYFGPIYSKSNDTIDTLALGEFALIGCEGNFQFGNASLSTIDLSTSSVQNNVFKNQNGEALGDVLQSIYLDRDRMFLVLNNSGLIRVLSSNSFKQMTNIEGLNSPRHMIGWKGKYFISDLYDNGLSVIDSATLEKEAFIPIEGWTERFAVFNDALFVGEIKGRSILKITKNLTVSAEVSLHMQPYFMLTVSNDQHLIVCGNRSDINQKGVIKKLDANALVIDSVSLNSTIVYACSTDDRLFILTSRSILEFDANSLKLVKTTTHQLKTPYGMGISSKSNSLLVADAKDYLSSGSITIIDAESAQIQSEIEVGPIPQFILVTEK
jgi:DNA-binding beta-propeller fold protein YncE